MKAAKRGSAMIKIVHGTIHGKTIELDQEVGVPDGQRVEVSVQIVAATQPPQSWGNGLRRCAGALAGIPGLAEDMEQILQERKSARFREVPE
jgi:citrate lyase beta subunit